MDNKNILIKLNSQYFKSLKRFEKMFRLNDTYYAEKLKEFNDGYLKIISAVINHDACGLDLSTKWIYTCATINEKDDLRMLIDSAH